MSDRAAPHSADIEANVIGACVLSRVAVADVARICTEADFYVPAHAVMYATVLAMWRNGDPIDIGTLIDHLVRDGTLERAGGHGGVMEVVTGTPSTSNAASYARIVVEYATRRRLIALGEQLVEGGYTNPDAADIIDRARTELAELVLPIGNTPDDLWSIDDFLDRPDVDRAGWVIPGLLRTDWRVVIVAPEGVGKSQLYRQIAMCAGQGVHPLNFNEIPPVVSLLVDFENPDDAVIEGCTPIRTQLLRTVDYTEHRAHLWHRPGGVNLRTRAGRADFEAVLAHVQPDLVCLGPLYKAYRRAPNENDEAASDHVQGILDELRTRYRFALLLEHHAPKKQAGVRDIEPYGSSYWLRWPEIGLGLIPEDDQNSELRVKRWRGDRLPNSWPDSLHRSKPWPWAGRWARGMAS